MLVVAGLSLKNLQPRVWDPESPYYLPDLKAVMVSYAEFHRMPRQRQAAMMLGLRDYLGVPPAVKVYLDNGAFYFLNHGGQAPVEQYEEFVEGAHPDWWPIPQDYIPSPSMSPEEQRSCFTRTVEVNLAYRRDGFVPVIHVGEMLEEYVAAVQSCDELATKPSIALGGVVPNLLRAPKAIPYGRVLGALRQVRSTFAGKQLHVFGLGGTATLHLGALIGVDSADSAGWRNRAARGLIQLPGGGDRTVVKLGSWRGRELSTEELQLLKGCPCPACTQHGLAGLRARGIDGSSRRAAHNLWVLLHEATEIERHLAAGSYASWFHHYLDNTIYLSLIQWLVQQREIEQSALEGQISSSAANDCKDPRAYRQ